MQITVPPDLEALVHDQIASGRFSSPEELLRRAIETLEFEELWNSHDRSRAEAHLEGILLDGLKSGDPIAITPQYLEQKRLSLIGRHNGITGTQ